VVLQTKETHVLNEKVRMDPRADARKSERFTVNKPALLVSVNQGLHGVASRKCQVVDISLGGAGVQVITTIGLPDHYYLCVLGLEERIGVAEAYRAGTRIGLRFIKEIDEYFLNRILRA